MARPLRIEFPGAIYHVTSRGDRRDAIFDDDTDRQTFLLVLARAVQRFDAQVLAYCLMGNHYHLVLHTRQANLSLLMRQLNGVYTQTFNRNHDKVGHVFQGRFKAILVDRDNYLLALCRYVDLNPVRARMVAKPTNWPWSSYRAHAGRVDAPEWLDTAGLHGYLLGHPADNAADHREAAKRYAALVASAPDLQIWTEGLRQQIYLGDDQFVEHMQALAATPSLHNKNIPKRQRLLTARPLHEWIAGSASRQEGLYLAHTQGGLSMTAIAGSIGLSVSRVSRLIARHEDEKAKGKT
jgi:REP element-mobilizing transposase RayT